MRIINTAPLTNPIDFFETPTDAILHGLTNPRARRVRDELPLVKGARVMAGTCTVESVAFELSNGLRLRYFIQNRITDWVVEKIDTSSEFRPSTFEPVILRSKVGGSGLRSCRATEGMH